MKLTNYFPPQAPLEIQPQDHVKARQNKYFTIIMLFSMFAAGIFYFLIYHYLKNELMSVQNRIVVLTKKTEKYHVSTSNINFSEIKNNIQVNQDQLKKLLSMMTNHPNIVWISMEVQKKIIKINGTANFMKALLSFVDGCEKNLHVHAIIKNIKLLPPFDSVEFQIQINRLPLVQNNALD